MDNSRFWKFVWQLHHYQGAVRAFWQGKVERDRQTESEQPKNKINEYLDLGTPKRPDENQISLEAMALLHPDLISISKG